jgi:hypothetical protein
VLREQKTENFVPLGALVETKSNGNGNGHSANGNGNGAQKAEKVSEEVLGD